ncbi:GnsB protein [Escherichia coli CFT073]|nr:GnsB protein [Escherichia coli CFT073]CAR06165.1 conserved hypothetical protein [Escherichia coli S88]
MRCFILSFIRLLHIIDTTVYQDSHNRLKEEMMNIEELKTKTEADISEYITKKIIELKKKTGKEVTSIQFTAREKMTGLESYDIKIDLI